MHFRVQGFDPAIHHLWKAGVVRHLSDCDRIFTQQAKGAPSREYFYTLLGESLGKFNNAGFIGNTDQCAGNFFVSRSWSPRVKKLIVQRVQ